MLKWRRLVNACELKAHQIGCWQNLGAVCFWQPISSGLNLVVAAVLRESVCRVIVALRGRLLYVVYVCKVEQFVLTIIERRLLLLLLFPVFPRTDAVTQTHHQDAVKTTPASYEVVNVMHSIQLSYAELVKLSIVPTSTVTKCDVSKMYTVRLSHKNVQLYFRL